MFTGRQIRCRHPWRQSLVTGLAGLALFLWLSVHPAVAQTTVVTHAELQAVDTNGDTIWDGDLPFTIRGVVLNDSGEMLDSTYDPDAVSEGRFGGQYQIFIQATDAADRGGTALWMAQNYHFIPGQDYDASEWANEQARVSLDTNSRAFRKGDWVEVTARKALFFNGKVNINEAHLVLPENNFDLRLVKANAGLPQAEALTLPDLVEADGRAIFNAARTNGGEYYQGMRVRLDGVRLADTNGWGKTNWSDRVCMATDDNGRSLPLRMPLTDLGSPPATSTWVSAVGILNQEGGNTNGYELFLQEIGPVLQVETTDNGSAVIQFSADYEGFVLEASDDGLSTWSEVDATPVKIIVMEEDATSTNRVYRLRKAD